MRRNNRMKMALIERRFGTHDPRNTKDNWKIKRGVPWYNPDYSGNGNTFSFIDAFGEVMTGPLEDGVNYSIVKDYDLLYVRLRGPKCAEAVKQLREQCPTPVIIAYTDELVNNSINDLCFRKSWIYDASLHVDVVTSSFPEKYERPKHEKIGLTNWEYCPYGSDVMSWRKWYKPLKEKDFIVAGMWHIRSYMRGGVGTREHIESLEILDDMQKQFGVKCRFFLNFDGHKVEQLIERYAENIALDVELIRHVPNNEFYEMLSKTKVFFEEYQCPCYSRATVVSASVGTPQVGTDMNTPSNVCFPDTTVTHGDWSGFREKIKLLLSDDKFYVATQEKALLMSKYFYYPSLKERLMKLYNECLEKRK